MKKQGYAESTIEATGARDFGNDEYSCKAAKTVKGVSQLIESGFDYVAEMDSVKLFRKRK
jgi:hypothetical protein